MKKIATLALLAVSMSGCMGTNRSHDRSVTPGAVGVQAKGDEEKRFSWRKISIGRLPRPVHYGYVKWRSLGRDDLGRPLEDGERVDVTWVYDTTFTLVGSLSPTGATLRFNKHGDPEKLGNMKLEDAIRAIFDIRDDSDVHLTKVKAPRT